MMIVPWLSTSARLALRGRRVHGDQNLGRVAGRQDVAIGEVDLEPADAGQCARRGAISAGKSGIVLTSLPKTADVLVNWVPVNCIPSPESPAKRMTTESRSSMM